MNHVLKELYHKIEMKISDYCFVYLRNSDLVWEVRN